MAKQLDGRALSELGLGPFRAPANTHSKAFVSGEPGILLFIDGKQ